MSGIAGIFHFDGAPVEPGLIEKMTGAMAYRGPDGLNHWVRGPIALGQCMLRTTQESLEEKQPLANEDESLVLVMDGWLSNWEELRAELLAKGARLRSRADAELVLRAYEAWGKDCLVHLDGDFALVVWDARKRSVFCVRDRMGLKPFHYHWDGRRLIIASDLHAILAVRSVPQEPNEGMIAEALSWEWLSRHETVWCGVMRLVGAHHMTVGAAGGPHIEQYWLPRLDADLGYKRDEDYIEHYRDLFVDCVRRSSRSYGTVACDVSGGHDSSAIFCVADYLRKVARLPAPAIKGYTVRHKARSDIDELDYARAVGRHLGLEIEETEAFAPDLSWFEAQARKDRDFPGAPNGASAVNVRMAMASSGSRVALCGEGGDEWLGANPFYYAEQILRRQWVGLYDSFRADVADFGLSQASHWLLSYGFTPIVPGLKETLRTLLRFDGASSSYEGAFWLSPQMRAKLRSRRVAADRSHSSIRNPLRRAMFETLNNAFRAHVMEKAERRASQIGIEIRAPFHDRRFIECAFAIPGRLRQLGKTTKLIHLRALADLLPSSVTERKIKATADSLFRAHLDHMGEEFTRIIPFEHPKWLDPVGMPSLYHAYLQRSSGRSWIWQLWGIYECHCVFQAKSGPLPGNSASFAELARSNV